MLWLRVRKTIGCLAFLIVVVSFLLVFQTAVQHGGNSVYISPSHLNPAQYSQEANREHRHQLTPHQFSQKKKLEQRPADHQERQQLIKVSQQLQRQQPPGKRNRISIEQLLQHQTQKENERHQHVLPPSRNESLSRQDSHRDDRIRNTLQHAGTQTSTPQCQPVLNVAFIKTHKAGSSTVANILQRFGLAHNLTFALPNRSLNTFGSNYIVKPGQKFTRDKLLPLINGHAQYNILWSHSIYNKSAFHEIMPENTVYISILREPFQQFVSCFEYYGVAKSMAKVNISQTQFSNNPISAFLQMPVLSRFHPKQYGYLRNKQAQDLGFGLDEFYQPDTMENYIEELDRDFKSVMIMEYFDESLILLRHKLCWEIKDIIYIPKNKNKHKPNRTFTDFDIAIHKSYSNVDYHLYHHFLLNFKNELGSQPIEFVEEVLYFKDLLNQVASHCPFYRPVAVPASKWNSPFTVTVDDCRKMKMSEMEGLALLRMRYFGY